jgi:hypothetical protein
VGFFGGCHPTLWCIIAIHCEAQHQQQDQHFNQMCENEAAARVTAMAQTASFNSFKAVFGKFVQAIKGQETPATVSSLD